MTHWRARQHCTMWVAPGWASVKLGTYQFGTKFAKSVLHSQLGIRPNRHQQRCKPYAKNSNSRITLTWDRLNSLAVRVHVVLGSWDRLNSLAVGVHVVLGSIYWPQKKMFVLYARCRYMCSFQKNSCHTCAGSDKSAPALKMCCQQANKAIIIFYRPLAQARDLKL